MELELIKPFINHDVEVLVAGVWIEGHMTPIVKGQITLLPIGDSAAFYGPTALKADVIQAIRQVKKVNTQVNKPASPVNEKPTVSALEMNTPGRFVIKK